MLSNVFTITVKDGPGTTNGVKNGLDEYQSREYCQPKPSCIEHPKKIFDTYINQELVDEWQEEFNGGSFGCICNDILVNNWDEFEDPVKVYKKKGYYSTLRDLVHANTVSGTFYHGTDYYKSADLFVGDVLDYSDRITCWCITADKINKCTNQDDQVIFKLECNNAVGLDLENHDFGYGKGIMLGECKLKMINKVHQNNQTMVSVTIV